jgi:energy-coupling factor transport system permease protein
VIFLKALSLYVNKESIIHSFDPMTKMAYIFMAVTVPFILPDLSVVFICMFTSLFLLLLGKVLHKMIPLFGFSFIVLLSIIVIQGMFMPENATVAFRIGPLTFYKEGLQYAALLCMRVIDILSAFSLLVLTTKPTDLIQVCVEKGLSPRIGYVMQSVLQIIPQMVATMNKISDAQRSRGMETEGNFLTRIRAFFPLLGPVVMNSFIQTRERAMALEVRAFNSPNTQTFLYPSPSHHLGRPLQILFLLIFMGAIVWRLIT